MSDRPANVPALNKFLRTMGIEETVVRDRSSRNLHFYGGRSHTWYTVDTQLMRADSYTFDQWLYLHGSLRRD
jgi:hypothetical protein